MPRPVPNDPPPGRPADDRLPAAECAEKLKALSDPIRLRLIDRLRDGPATVTELADRLAIDLMLASHHLRLLKHAGFVDRRPQGRFAIYSLRPNVLTASRRGDQLDLGCCRLQLPPEGG